MAASALDFWFEFSSTYSYPAAMRIGALAAEAGVEVRLRPFLLGPIFQAHGWNTSPFILYPAKGRHMWRDLERICAALSLPFRRPEHFRNRGFWQHAWRWWGCRILRPRQLGRVFRHAVSSRGIRRRAPHRSVGDDPRYPVGVEVDPEKTLAATQTDEIKISSARKQPKRNAWRYSARRAFITADGELFWENDRLESAIAWASMFADTFSRA